MTSAPLTAAEIEIQFVEHTLDPIARVLEALRAFRLVGFVETGTVSGDEVVSGMLSFVPQRGLAVDAGEAIASTPAQPIVDALSARLGAAVLLMFDEEEYGAYPVFVGDQGDPDEGDPDEASDDESADAATQLYVLGGNVSLAADRRAELAVQVGSSVTAVPLAGHTLVVPDTAQDLVYWPVAQRPVVALQLASQALVVRVYSRTAVTTVPRRRRISAMVLPDWAGAWVPAPAPVLPDTDDEREPLAVQRALIRSRTAELTAHAITDPEVLAETGIDGARLAELMPRPFRADIVPEVVAALGLPAVVGAVLAGEESGARLPGAVRIENRGLRGVAADSLLAEPEDSSFLARWRRIPHRHPRLAVVLIVAELASAAVLVVAAMLPPFVQPLTTMQWASAAILAVVAVADAALLRSIRRRRGD